MFEVGQTVFVTAYKRSRAKIENGEFVAAKIIEVHPMQRGAFLYTAETDDEHIYRYSETPAYSPYSFFSKEELLLILDEGLEGAKAKAKKLNELYQKYQNYV